MNMKKLSMALTTLFGIGLLIFNSCGTVPITGRRQLNLVSDGEILAASSSASLSSATIARTTTRSLRWAVVWLLLLTSISSKMATNLCSRL